MAQNQATNEKDVQAPARLKRDYWSTYFHIPSGKNYRQMGPGINNNWEEITDAFNECDTCNDQIYSIKVRLSKEQISSIEATPVPITREMLGLAEDEAAQVLQDMSIWRMDPNFNPFTV